VHAIGNRIGNRQQDPPGSGMLAAMAPGDIRETRLRPADLAPLGVGLAALAVGTAFGWDARLVEAVVAPPPIIRAALVAASAVIGGALFVAALRRLGAGAGTGGETGGSAEPDDPPDLATMVRGVRLVFLSLAAFAAAAGWVVGHPLPIVIALVIAGVDVIETSFLLLIVGARRR